MSALSQVAPQKVLVLTPRSWTSLQFEDAVPTLESALNQAFPPLQAPDIVDLQDWYDISYGASGSRDAWFWETVNGKDYGTRKPHYQAFITVTERLDNRTAQIASLALRHNKLVLSLNQAGKLFVVSSLRERDDDAGGWITLGNPIS